MEFAFYNLFDNPDILKGLLDGEFEINVNRYENSSDASVPIAIDRDKQDVNQKLVLCSKIDGHRAEEIWRLVYAPLPTTMDR